MAESFEPIVGSEIVMTGGEGRLVYLGDVVPEGTAGAMVITVDSRGYFSVELPESRETLPPPAEPE